MIESLLAKFLPGVDSIHANAFVMQKNVAVLVSNLTPGGGRGEGLDRGCLVCGLIINFFVGFLTLIKWRKH